MNTNNDIGNIVKSFDEIVSKPEHYISVEHNLIKNIRGLLKSTYDFSKQQETKSSSNALPELIIQNFDLEQIWQQLELQNDFILSKSVEDVSKLAVSKEKLLFNNIPETTKETENEIEDDIGSFKGSEDNFETDDEFHEESQNQNDDTYTKKFKPSLVDDNFFKLAEMNNFLLTEEKKMNPIKQPLEDHSDSDVSVDMFKANSEDESDDDDADTYNNKKNPRYKDFFGTITQQMEQQIWRDGEDEDSNEDEYEVDNNRNEDDNIYNEEKNYGDDEIDLEYNSKNETDNSKNFKSPLELREERLKEKIKELEDAAVGEKPWQLKGEILADNRPINSLLEEVLEYDVGSRPAPVITEAATLLLEDAIKQRIKDKSFDDVERKEKPVDTPLEYKKKLLLDQEKSKQSLAQIYEKEYLQQKESLQEADERDEEDPALHKEITSMMYGLFSKLDALSNFHFTPKPVAPELKVVSNLPAINMEEVAPIAMTSASQLAPEEVKRKTKGDVLGKNERTVADKNRERRKKKRKQREHAKNKLKNDLLKRPGLGNKYSKEKVKEIFERVSKETNVDKMDDSYGSKRIKSSTAFFTQLQEAVTSQIKSKTKSPKKTKNVLNAKKLKL